MSFLSNTQSLSTERVVLLYAFNFDELANYTATVPSTLFFTAESLPTGGEIAFNSNTYKRIPIVMTGVSAELGGKIPEPVIRIGFPSLMTDAGFAAILNDWRTQNPGLRRLDWRGVSIIRLEVFASNLDGAPNADPTQAETVLYNVDQVVSATNSELVLKVNAPFGVENLSKNAVRVLRENHCARIYRRPAAAADTFNYTPVEDGGCPYGQASEASIYPGAATPFGSEYFDGQNQPTGDWQQDRCPKTYQACTLRFRSTGNPNTTVPFLGTLPTRNNPAASLPDFDD